ncbi:hypothetical protein [Agreia sp. COWG]|uniref:hypothetical protein n=1 Tax=Agreia sp. COWG TaxID=2773266 RepID=UPI0019292A78|nr:hypothetical protein [Agreia sp. COWG]CAD6000170.1 conserved protein of unknown function [Agreia sp. COWG]
MTPQRRRFALLALPFAVVAVAVAIKLIGMIALSSLGSAAYARGDFEGATALARWQTIANVIDPWKAHFAVGDGLAARQLDAEAEKEFDRALELAAPADECPVRVNLVVVLERQGDAALAADAAAVGEARAYYDRALDVIADADDACLAPPVEGRGPTAEQLEGSKQRIEAKQGALSDEEPADQEGDPADDAPTDDTVKQLKEKLGESGQDRSDQQKSDRAPAQPGSVDKPW